MSPRRTVATKNRVVGALEEWVTKGTAPPPSRVPRIADGTGIAAENVKAAGDPRPSLEERYGSRAAYVAKVRATAQALVAERLLLPADAAFVAAAKICDQRA